MSEVPTVDELAASYHTHFVATYPKDAILGPRPLDAFSTEKAVVFLMERRQRAILFVDVADEGLTRAFCVAYVDAERVVVARRWPFGRSQVERDVPYFVLEDWVLLNGARALSKRVRFWLESKLGFSKFADKKGSLAEDSRRQLPSGGQVHLAMRQRLLRALAARDGPRILVLSGRCGSGKTHLVQQVLSEVAGSVRVFRADATRLNLELLKEERGASAVASLLCGLLGAQIPLSRETSKRAPLAAALFVTLAAALFGTFKWVPGIGDKFAVLLEAVDWAAVRSTANRLTSKLPGPELLVGQAWKYLTRRFQSSKTTPDPVPQIPLIELSKGLLLLLEASRITTIYPSQREVLWLESNGEGDDGLQTLIESLLGHTDVLGRVSPLVIWTRRTPIFPARPSWQQVACEHLFLGELTEEEARDLCSQLKVEMLPPPRGRNPFFLDLYSQSKGQAVRLFVERLALELPADLRTHLVCAAVPAHFSGETLTRLFPDDGAYLYEALQKTSFCEVHEERWRITPLERELLLECLKLDNPDVLQEMSSSLNESERN